MIPAVFRSSISAAVAVAAMLSLACPQPVCAQQTPGWFVPQSPAPAATAAPSGRKGRQRPAQVAPLAQPEVEAPPPSPEDQSGGAADQLTEAEMQQQAAKLPQPPAPALPDIVSSFYSETATGDAVKVTATGPNAALPAPLAADAIYYLIKGAQNVVQLAGSAADAAAGTPMALENAGVGTLRVIAPLAHTGQKNATNDFTVTMPNQLKLLPGGATPPVPLIGVLGVPDVMRASSAAQAVDKVIGARKEKLQMLVQAAQANWRQMEQSLRDDAPRISRDQALTRERALRDRVSSDRHSLQEQNRKIQEAAQVALGQIERTLIGIIRQVAEARGMNLVLHRSQVALNVQEYDITEAVTEQLNRALPTVQIPPDNVDPATLPKDWGTPAAATR